MDWMFILTLEWFGLPDERKQHSEQLDYGFKGKSNDQLRQAWMATVVPFMEEIGIRVPAHLDAEQRPLRDRLPVPGARSTPSQRAGCSTRARSRGTT